MRPEKSALIEYLKTKTAGALVMSPQELACEIRVSAKQQSKLRQQQRFPIPHQQAGRRVVYSLFAIADFLLDGRAPPPSEDRPAIKPPVGRASGRSGLKSEPQDLSHIFLLRNFFSALEEQRSTLDVLCNHFSAFLKAAPLAEHLAEALPEKEEKRPIKPRSV